jgi:hypothetical protein
MNKLIRYNFSDENELVTVDLSLEYRDNIVHAYVNAAVKPAEIPFERSRYFAPEDCIVIKLGITGIVDGLMAY